MFDADNKEYVFVVKRDLKESVGLALNAHSFAFGTVSG